MGRRLLHGRVHWDRAAVLLPVALSLLATSGCVASKIDPAKLITPLQRLESLASEPPADPDRVLAECAGFLRSSRAFDKPVGAYQQELEAGIQRVCALDSAHVPPEGVGHLYDARVRSMAVCYLAMAQAHFAKKELKHCERAARNGWELAFARGLSPIFVAEHAVKCWTLLARVHAARGEALSELAASLRVRLAQGYLGSPQATDDREADRRVEQTGLELVTSINEVISEANSAKATYIVVLVFLMITIFGAAGAGAMQQQAISDATIASGGVVTPEIQQMQAQHLQNQAQWNQMVVNMAQSLSDLKSSVQFSVPSDHFDSVLQLVDRRRGEKTHELYREFLHEVQEKSGQEDTRRRAGSLLSRVNELERIASRGDFKDLAAGEREKAVNLAMDFRVQFRALENGLSREREAR